MKRSTLFVALLLAILSITTTSTGQAERLVLASASYGKNIIAICEMDGKVIWQHKTGGPKRGHTGHHDLHLLPNGNILFHDTWTKIHEMTLGGKIVWTYDSATANGNKGKRVHVHAFQRLANGNTLATESDAGRALEIAPDGGVVWEFSNPHRAGPDNEYVATLFEVERIDPAYVAGWLELP